MIHTGQLRSLNGSWATRRHLTDVILGRYIQLDNGLGLMQFFVPVCWLQKYLQFVFAFGFFRGKTNGLVSETISHDTEKPHMTSIPGVGARV